MQQRDHNLVMPGEVELFATGQGWPSQDVLGGAIVGDHVEIGGGEFVCVMSEVARYGQGLQEYFGHYYSTAEVHYYSAFT
ncbi:MAG: hypothetical protein HN590_18575 [Calditrichaeota bacterium]|nr:hypothetical protein [Calditrichota bacterium]